MNTIRVESGRKEIGSDLSPIPGISQIMIVKQASGYIGGRLRQWCVPRALNSRHLVNSATESRRGDIQPQCRF